MIWDLIILGGGAAGLASAVGVRDYCRSTSLNPHVSKPRQRLSVLLVDKQEKLGRKLLATGNGRCNCSHQTYDWTHYRSHDKSGLKRVFSTLRDGLDRNLFDSISLPVKWDQEGRGYPVSEEALAVQQRLIEGIQKAGIQIQTATKIVSVERTGVGFSLRTDLGKILYCRKLILSVGGQAGSQLGADNSLRCLAKQLELSYYDEHPALAAFVTGETSLTRQASGSRFKGKMTWENWDSRGEFLWAEDGLSGIAALDLSVEMAGLPGEFCQQKKGKKPFYRFSKPQIAYLDFIDALSERELEEFLLSQKSIAASVDRKKATYAPFSVRDALLGVLPHKLASGLSKSESSLMEPFSSTTDCLNWARRLKRWPVQVIGVRGFEQAQVAYGGISLGEIDDCFQAVAVPNLFICGEALDIVGKTGGYNLAFAFSSGYKAGQEAIRSILAEKIPNSTV